MQKLGVFFLCAFSTLLTCESIQAAAFGPGDLVVLRVGTGSGALASSATAGFLDEFSVGGGAAVQSLAIATAVSGSQDALTFSGTATSEGQLLLSENGKYLTFAGYNAAPGTASVTTSAASAVNRVVGVVGSTGVIDTSTAINSGITTGNPRSAVSSDGNQIWMATSANGVESITKGTVGAGTQLSTTPSNTRVVGLSLGQMYVSAASGAFLGVSTIGTGEPTTSGQTTTALPGFPITGTHSPYDFLFANSTTLYVADDGSAASGGGIGKWTLSGGTWSLQYTLLNNGTTTTGIRAFTLDTSGANPIIYALTSSGGSLISITDTGAGSTSTVLETAAANTAFRGIAFAPSPVPEPSTLAMAIGGGVACMFALRRKR